MKRRDRLPTINILALAITLLLLIGLCGFFVWTAESDDGYVFATLFFVLSPILFLLALVGAGVYIALMVANKRAAARREKAGITTKRLGYRGEVLGWLTMSFACLFFFCAASGYSGLADLVSSINLRNLRNPFVMARARPVPKHPYSKWFSQSWYVGIDEGSHRSYSADNWHPDVIAGWYQEAMSMPPWTVIETDRYMAHDGSADEMIGHCIQAQRSEGNWHQRPYYVEIWGADQTFNSPTHVNIGVWKPISGVCRRFVDEP